MRGFSGLVDYMQCVAPDSLANLVKSLVKHRGRVFRRITLKTLAKNSSAALKIFVSLSLVVRHLLPPRWPGDVLSG
jgi:hypothetical protein